MGHSILREQQLHKISEMFTLSQGWYILLRLFSASEVYACVKGSVDWHQSIFVESGGPGVVTNRYSASFFIHTRFLTTCLALILQKGLNKEEKAALLGLRTLHAGCI